MPAPLAAALVGLLSAHAAQGAIIYWDGTGTAWNAVGSWSSVAGAATPDPAAVPGVNDTATFSISTLTNTAQTVNLNAAQSVLGLSFLGTNTATTLLQGGGVANQTLTLGTSGISVASLAGAVTIGSTSALQNVAIILGGAQSWTNNSANALTVVNGVTDGGFLLTLAGTGAINLNGVLSGSGGLTNGGSGVTTLSGANTYTGLTTISAGTLAYGVTNALSSGGVTVNGGTLDMKTFSDTVGTVTLSAGSITGSTGVLTGTSYVLNNATGTTTASAILGGAVTLAKSGVGTAILSGANTYTGATTVTAGVLNIQNATALGTVAGGVTVSANAALQIQGGISVGAEALSLNGTGIATDGALRNISGTNTYGGLVTLGSATRINSDAGTLTLSIHLLCSC